MGTGVELNVQEGAARVTFRGPRGIQIFDAAARASLGDVLTEIETLDRQAAVRIVVFQAEGRSFIAGADIRELAQLDFAAGAALASEGQELMNRIADLNAVTIAALQGACAGGGCELALACDLRMAAESARLGLPEVGLGLIPGWGGTVRAVQLFGGAVARRLILTGELLSSQEALRLGIVDSVAPDDSFAAAVDERIALLLSRGPHALRAAKRLIRQFEGASRPSQLAHEAQVFARCCAHPEAAEGTRAFLEKRPPNWPPSGEQPSGK